MAVDDQRERHRCCAGRRIHIDRSFRDRPLAQRDPTVPLPFCAVGTVTAKRGRHKGAAGVPESAMLQSTTSAVESLRGLAGAAEEFTMAAASLQPSTAHQTKHAGLLCQPAS